MEINSVVVNLNVSSVIFSVPKHEFKMIYTVKI